MKELDDYMKEIRERESEVIRKIEALRSKISPAEAELSQIDVQRSELMAAEAKARRGLTTAYRLHSQAQLTFTRKQEQLDNLRERIENDLGLVSFEYDADISGPTPLPIGGMVESLPRLKELPQGMEKTLQRQRTQVRRMGSVNPEAQSEYKQVKERFDFMTAQIDDLHNAERDIKQVIAELEAIMQREFRITFDKVAAEFRETFTRLFGGGSARLLLTDPDDLTQTGIDIEARLPGRKTQGLSLLSGGERSLTAAALVFSLLKVSPTPFCVLDEVDAMLDEANVGRFRDLLRELSENTQFIVITHNRNTVQAADVIYGVTMGRDSVSQMISLRLDEVAEVV
jgi:chromosome segregation protein